MEKTLKKWNTKWFLLFLFMFCGVGIHASEWDEYAGYGGGGGGGSYTGWNPDGGYRDYGWSQLFAPNDYSSTVPSYQTGGNYVNGVNEYGVSRFVVGQWTSSSYSLTLTSAGGLPSYGPINFIYGNIYSYSYANANTILGSTYTSTIYNLSGIGGWGNAPPTNPPCNPIVCEAGYTFVNCGCVKIPKDPCIQAAINNLRSANAIIAKQNIEIRKKSTYSEYGAEQNLLAFPVNASPEFKDVVVRTNNISDHFSYKFTWNATDGYTCGVSHGHPSGSGPSPADIFTAYSNLTEPQLLAGGQQAIDYYKDNFAITVVTKSQTFVVNVTDWEVFGKLATTYFSNITEREKINNQYKAKGVDYIDLQGPDYNENGRFEPNIYAALQLFKGAISIYKYDKGTLKFAQLTLDAVGDVITNPCNK